MSLPPIANKTFLWIMITLLSCGKSADGIESNELIYNNDFESGDLISIDGAQLITFNKNNRSNGSSPEFLIFTCLSI